MGISSDRSAESVSELTEADRIEPSSLSPLRVLAGMLIHPRTTIKNMQTAKRKHWWLVFLLLVVATALLTYVTLTTRSTMFQRSEFPEGFTPPAGAEMPEGVQPSNTGTASLTLSILLPTTTGAAGALLNYLIGTIVIFGMGLIVGGKAEFRQLFPVVAWATLPLVLRKLVHATVTLVTGKVSVAGFSGLLTVAEAASMPLVYTLLGQFDIYLLWYLLLLGIGAAVTSKLSRGKSTMVVLVYLGIAAAILLVSSWATVALTDLLGMNIRMPGMMGPRFGR